MKYVANYAYDDDYVCSEYTIVYRKYEHRWRFLESLSERLEALVEMDYCI